MKQPSSRQERILSLIDGYQSDFGGEFDAGSKQGQLSRIVRELHRWPGHWFLVGQISRRGGAKATAGARAVDLKRHGCETAEVDGKQYARIPGEGVPLMSLVTRPEKRQMHERLPAVASDKFGWSRNELANAKATARAWLFPIEGIAV